MKKVIICLVFGFLIPLNLIAQYKLEIIDHFWGDSLVGNPKFKVDNTGNIIMALTFEGSININETYIHTDSTGAVLVKMNPLHEISWIKIIEGESDVGISDLDIGAHNSLFIQGHFNPTLKIDEYTLENKGLDESFICQLDSMGNVQWLKRGISQSDTYFVAGIKSHMKNNLYTCGYKPVSDTNRFNKNTHPPFIGFIAKYTDNNEYEWLYEFDFFKDLLHNEGSEISSMALDSAGNCYWIGSGTYKDSIIVGNDTLLSMFFNHFLGMLNSDGELLWQKIIKAPYNSSSCFKEIFAPSNDFCTLHGEAEAALYFPDTLTLGVYNGFIAQFNAMGDYVWGISLPMRINASYTSTASYTFISGYKYSYGDFNGFSVYSHDTLVYIESIPELEILGFSEGPDGLIYLFCNLLSDITIQNQTVNPKGNSDALIVRFNPKTALATHVSNPEPDLFGSIYPNPAANYINIQCNENKVESFILYNSMGIKVQNKQNIQSSNIWIGDLIPGLYIYAYKTKYSIRRGVFIKQ